MIGWAKWARMRLSYVIVIPMVKLGYKPLKHNLKHKLFSCSPDRCGSRSQNCLAQPTGTESAREALSEKSISRKRKRLTR
jgi:hypothetical protein